MFIARSLNLSIYFLYGRNVHLGNHDIQKKKKNVPLRFLFAPVYVKGTASL